MKILSVWEVTRIPVELIHADPIENIGVTDVGYYHFMKKVPDVISFKRGTGTLATTAKGEWFAAVFGYISCMLAFIGPFMKSVG